MRNLKTIFIVLLGTVLEYYDFMLYMNFVFFITPLYFPSEDPLTSSLFGMTSFAVSYCMRPLGGIAFGFIGDKWGRKIMLTLSIMTMCLPTLMIGFLPTYETIGIFAPFLLMGCRLIQGFSVGGEVSAANIFLVESAVKGRECVLGSLLNSAAFSGGVLGALLGFVFTQPFMPYWSWRIPFILGGLIGIIGYIIRLKLNETPAFTSTKSEDKGRKDYVFSWTKENFYNFLCVIGLSSGVIIPTSLTFVYIVNILKNELHITQNQILFNNSIILMVMVILQPIFGHLGDKIGMQKVIKISSCFLTFLAGYLVLSTLNESHLATLFIIQLLIMGVASGISGPVCAYLVALYPILQRGKWLGTGWSMGVILFNFTALLVLYFSQWIGHIPSMSCALAASGVMTWIAIYFSKPISFQENSSLNLKEAAFLIQGK